MTYKKLVFRAAAVVTVAAFAAPALPCSDEPKQTHAMATQAPAATGAPATTTPKDAVAKQAPRPDKGKQQGKTSTATKPTATN